MKDTETQPTPVVSLVGVDKVYGSGPTRVVALSAVSLDLAAGEFIAVMGPSGSGKSTLLHCAAGLDRINRGQILIAGRLIGRLSDRQLSFLRRQYCGFVFQSYNLVPTMNVFDNICLPDAIAGQRRDRSEVIELADQLGLSDRLKHHPHELSGGQQQRVAVARALVRRPPVVFADEPTGNLDTKASADLLAILKEGSKARNQGIIMVTHDPLIAAAADRVIILRDGVIVDQVRRPTTASIRQRLNRLESAVTKSNNQGRRQNK